MSGGYRQQGGNDRLRNYRSVDERIREFWAEMRASGIPARIFSHPPTITDDHAQPRLRFHAEVWAHVGGAWVMLANGYAEEIIGSSAAGGKLIENGETSAIGRALANAGYTSNAERASVEEMDSYESAKEFLTTPIPNATPSAPQATESHEAPHEDKSIAVPAQKAPQATTARRKPTATQAKAELFTDASDAPKVGVVTAAGKTDGATVEEAMTKQEQLNIAGLPASEIASPKLADAAVKAASKEEQAEAVANAELEQHSPGFRKWIETRYVDAEDGNDFATIADKFKAMKEKMTDAQYTTARKHLAIIKRRCEVIAASGSEESALKADVATELAQLTDEERQFLSA